MPSLDSGEPGGTLQTFFQDTVPAGSSVKSATSMSVQPAAAAAAAIKASCQH
jgi:cytochrome c oxidase assembly protein Cox11